MGQPMIKAYFAAKVLGGASGAVIAGAVIDQLSGKTTVSLGEVLAVSSVVIVSGWWAGIRYQKFADQLEQNTVAVTELKDRMKHLPCAPGGPCEHAKDKQENDNDYVK